MPKCGLPSLKGVQSNGVSEADGPAAGATVGGRVGVCATGSPTAGLRDANSRSSAIFGNVTANERASDLIQRRSFVTEV